MIRLSLLTTDGAVSVESPRVRFFVRDGDNEGNRSLCMDYEGNTFTFFRFDEDNIPGGITRRVVGGVFFGNLLRPGPEAALAFAHSLYHGAGSALGLPEIVQFNVNSIWKSLEEFRVGTEEISGIS